MAIHDEEIQNPKSESVVLYTTDLQAFCKANNLEYKLVDLSQLDKTNSKYFFIHTGTKPNQYNSGHTNHWMFGFGNYIFDSYGAVGDFLIPHDMKYVECHPSRLQEYGSNVCGEYCCVFYKFLTTMDDPNSGDIGLEFSHSAEMSEDRNRNDRIIQALYLQEGGHEQGAGQAKQGGALKVAEPGMLSNTDYLLYKTLMIKLATTSFNLITNGETLSSDKGIIKYFYRKYKEDTSNKDYALAFSSLQQAYKIRRAADPILEIIHAARVATNQNEFRYLMRKNTPLDLTLPDIKGAFEALQKDMFDKDSYRALEDYIVREYENMKEFEYPVEQSEITRSYSIFLDQILRMPNIVQDINDLINVVSDSARQAIAKTGRVEIINENQLEYKDQNVKKVVEYYMPQAIQIADANGDIKVDSPQRQVFDEFKYKGVPKDPRAINSDYNIFDPKRDSSSKKEIPFNSKDIINKLREEKKEKLKELMPIGEVVQPLESEFAAMKRFIKEEKQKEQFELELIESIANVKRSNFPKFDDEQVIADFPEISTEYFKLPALDYISKNIQEASNGTLTKSQAVGFTLKFVNGLKKSNPQEAWENAMEFVKFYIKADFKLPAKPLELEYSKGLKEYEHKLEENMPENLNLLYKEKFEIGNEDPDYYIENAENIQKLGEQIEYFIVKKKSGSTLTSDELKMLFERERQMRIDNEKEEQLLLENKKQQLLLENTRLEQLLLENKKEEQLLIGYEEKIQQLRLENQRVEQLLLENRKEEQLLLGYEEKKALYFANQKLGQLRIENQKEIQLLLGYETKIEQLNVISKKINQLLLENKKEIQLLIGYEEKKEQLRLESERIEKLLIGQEEKDRLLLENKKSEIALLENKKKVQQLLGTDKAEQLLLEYDEKNKQLLEWLKEEGFDEPLEVIKTLEDKSDRNELGFLKKIKDLKKFEMIQRPEYLLDIIGRYNLPDKIANLGEALYELVVRKYGDLKDLYVHPKNLLGYDGDKIEPPKYLLDIIGELDLPNKGIELGTDLAEIVKDYYENLHKNYDPEKEQKPIYFLDVIKNAYKSIDNPFSFKLDSADFANYLEELKLRGVTFSNPTASKKEIVALYMLDKGKKPRAFREKLGQMFERDDVEISSEYSKKLYKYDVNDDGYKSSTGTTKPTTTTTTDPTTATIPTTGTIPTTATIPTTTATKPTSTTLDSTTTNSTTTTTDPTTTTTAETLPPGTLETFLDKLGLDASDVPYLSWLGLKALFLTGDYRGVMDTIEAFKRDGIMKKTTVGTTVPAPPVPPPGPTPPGPTVPIPATTPVIPPGTTPAIPPGGSPGVPPGSTTGIGDPTTTTSTPAPGAAVPPKAWYKELYEKLYNLPISTVGENDEKTGAESKAFEMDKVNVPQQLAIMPEPQVINPTIPFHEVKNFFPHLTNKQPEMMRERGGPSLEKRKAAHNADGSYKKAKHLNFSYATMQVHQNDTDIQKGTVKQPTSQYVSPYLHPQVHQNQMTTLNPGELKASQYLLNDKLNKKLNK